MTGQVEQFTIPLPRKFLERRRDYLAGEYDRLLGKIGAFDKTALKDIVALSLVHVQLSQTLEALAERTAKELPDDCDC